MVVIWFETDSAAFDNYYGNEVARILRRLADRAERDPADDSKQRILDVNGNLIGFCELHRGDEKY